MIARDPATFGGRLYVARRHAADKTGGLTLAELAARTGLSVPYLSDLERGNLDNPSLTTLMVIARTLRVSLDWLVFGGEKL